MLKEILLVTVIKEFSNQPETEYGYTHLEHIHKSKDSGSRV